MELFWQQQKKVFSSSATGVRFHADNRVLFVIGILLCYGLCYGFLKNRSCVNQLLSVLHAIGEALDKNIQSDLIYLDFTKAFDSVDHSILLASSAKITPFMELFWQQQKKMFSSSATGVRFHADNRVLFVIGILLCYGLCYGFLKNRSCVNQLLSVLHAIGEALDKNIQSDLIYLDFAKAFDSVDHSILLAKLNAYGVSGPLFAWFTDYLTGRAQRVVVEGAASKWAPVTSGVPQGSLLGPILFTIFINDLPDEVVGRVRVALYADDTKLYKSVTSVCDCQSLQTTLGNLNSWSKHNRIKFNTSKCKSLTVTRKKFPLVHEYTLDSAQLEHVSTEKDLGVHITSSLSWKPHIHAITAKANKLLGLLKRTCPLITDVTVQRTLFLSLVKSQLRHASLLPRSSHPKGPSRASTTPCHPLDFTNSGGRGLL